MTDPASKSPCKVSSEVLETEPFIPSSPGLVIQAEGGTIQLNENLRERAFGAEDDGFIKGTFSYLSQFAVIKGELDDTTLKFIGGALVEINPKNGLEALLASQIIVNHIISMKFGRMLLDADTIPRTEALERVFTKVSRTLPAHVEALHKLRNGGKQKVTVEHVHVHEGGQAIVGNIEQGGGQK